MNRNTKKMVLLGMLSAVAFLLVALIRIPLLPAVPFLNYEPKDVIITVGGFLLGPLSALIITVIVALVEMFTISTTGIIGCFMNLLSSACFACTASLIYKHKRTLTGAAIGLGAGSLAMVAVMLLWNWLITPLYMGVPREYVETLLFPAFLPFNALKAGFNTALTLMLYKPLSSALSRTGLLPQRSRKSAKWGIYLLGAALLATCILLLLVLRRIL